MDKRTKAYKEYKRKQANQSTGLGDDVKKVTKATGIDKAVKFVAGQDCGCDERQAYLNKIFTYDVPKCLTEKEFNYLADYFSKDKTNVTKEEQKELVKIHNRIFAKQLSTSSCVPCVKQLVSKLNRVVKEYL